MNNNDEAVEPQLKQVSWKLVYAALAFLAITGLTLSIVYRQMPKKTSVVERERRRQAQHAAFTIMLAPIGQQQAQKIAEFIINDIGADSATTDLVVASTVTDPWCASIEEYRQTIINAGANTKELSLRKQGELMSMIAGLLTKTTIPSTLYICGYVNANDLEDIATRTLRTAQAIQIRSSLAAPIRVVNLLSNPSSDVHKQYIALFTSAGITVVQPTAILP
jgi:hypothetical protein